MEEATFPLPRSPGAAHWRAGKGSF